MEICLRRLFDRWLTGSVDVRRPVGLPGSYLSIGVLRSGFRNLTVPVCRLLMLLQLSIDAAKLETSIHRAITVWPFADQKRRDLFHLSNVNILVSSTFGFLVVVKRLNVRGHRHVRSVLRLYGVVITVIIRQELAKNRGFVIIPRQQMHVRQVVTGQVQVVDWRVTVRQPQCKSQQTPGPIKMMVQVCSRLLDLFLILCRLSSSQSVQKRLSLLGSQFLTETKGCIEIFRFVIGPFASQFDVKVSFFKSRQILVLPRKTLNHTHCR